MTPQQREERVTGLAALGTVVLALPVFAIAVLYPTPPASAGAESLVENLAEHRLAFQVGLYLSALGWSGVLLVFAAGLWAILRRAEGDSGVWSLVAFGACVATSAAILVCILLAAALVYRAPNIDAATASVLSDASGIANLMTAFPNAIYVIAAAIVIRRTSVLPSWLAHGALAVAAIHLLSATSQARSGLFAPFGLLPSLAPLSHTVWLAGVAFVLLRR